MSSMGVHCSMVEVFIFGSDWYMLSLQMSIMNLSNDIYRFIMLPSLDYVSFSPKANSIILIEGHENHEKLFERMVQVVYRNNCLLSYISSDLNVNIIYVLNDLISRKEGNRKFIKQLYFDHESNWICYSDESNSDDDTVEDWDKIMEE